MSDLNFPDDEPVFPISTAAKLLNISVHTLRMYEKEGLIIAHKSCSNHRLYSQKDLERIQCIRNSINYDKISIAGIKSILSLIPCWEINHCEHSTDECKAFTEHSQPCWLMKKKDLSCEGKDCRQCEVYKTYSECDKIKEKIVTISI